jgi:hypothetical protein
MTQAATLVARILVTLLAISAIVGQVAQWDALSGVSLGLSDTLAPSPRASFLTLVAADAVVTVISSVLAIALVYRGKAAQGARGLAVALAAWSYLLAYSGIIVLLRPDPGVARAIFEAHFPLVELLGLAGMMHFTAMFPRRLTPEHLTPAQSLPVGLRTLQGLRGRLLSPAAPWLAVVVVIAVLLSVNALLGRSIADAGLNPLMDLTRFLAVGVVVVNLRRSWLGAAAEERAKMWWILVGLALLMAAIALLIGGNIFLSATGWSEPTVAWRPILLDLGLAGLLWGLWMAVFYSGAADSAAAARRVVALTALALTGIGIATGLEVLLSSALVARVSLPRGLGTAVAVVVMIVGYSRGLAYVERGLEQIPGIAVEATPAARLLDRALLRAGGHESVTA